MSEIRIDFAKCSGRIKPMHCVNNGPLPKRGDQTRDNFDTYKAAKIPYMRNHDASFCAAYGGGHTVDVHMIFPDFDADPYDPASYDFALTDLYMQNTLAAGTKIFYRLGSKIEHEPKKYGTLVPKDFQKWAVICEHIIRHMNEGWADGHHFDIEYWEIWNEPDLGEKTWAGTKEQFFSLYETAARHLKACFPALKIGGPALCGNFQWAEDFMRYLSEAKPRVPLDFFSWHIYAKKVESVADRCRAARALLDKYGFTGTESILNEYNFVLDWSPRFVESIEAIISMPGAAFTASCFLAGQNSPVDMLMYYDARPSVFNGMWDYYTERPLKGYYPFLMFSRLYELGTSVPVETDVQPQIWAAAAKNDAGEKAIMLSYFRYEGGEEITVTLDTGLDCPAMTLTALDAERTMTESTLLLDGGRAQLTVKPNSVLLITSRAAK